MQDKGSYDLKNSYIYKGCFRNFVAFNKGWLICAPGCSLSAGRAVSPFRSNQPVLSKDIFIKNNNLFENSLYITPNKKRTAIWLFFLFRM